MVKKQNPVVFLKKEDVEHQQVEVAIVSYTEAMTSEYVLGNGQVIRFKFPRKNNEFVCLHNGAEIKLSFCDQIDINRIIDKWGEDESKWVGKPLLVSSKLDNIGKDGKRYLKWSVVGGVE